MRVRGYEGIVYSNQGSNAQCVCLRVLSGTCYVVLCGTCVGSCCCISCSGSVLSQGGLSSRATPLHRNALDGGDDEKFVENHGRTVDVHGGFVCTRLRCIALSSTRCTALHGSSRRSPAASQCCPMPPPCTVQSECATWHNQPQPPSQQSSPSCSLPSRAAWEQLLCYSPLCSHEDW